MSDEWKYANAIMATGFRVGRMAQESGAQLVWIEIHRESGPPLPFVCLPEHARELAELLVEEAGNPI